MTGDKAARDLKLAVAKCELCGWANVDDLQVHEVLRGPLRRLARGVACCSLVLCGHRGNNCHAMMGGKSWEYQLAILWRSRRDDFDLLRFWEIAGRRKPTPEELLSEVTR